MKQNMDSTARRWERAKALSGWVVALILGLSLLAVVSMATSPGFSTVVQPGSMTLDCTFLEFTDGTNYFVRNCQTGSVPYSGASWETVTQTALNAMASGGKLQFAPGTYYANPATSGLYVGEAGTWTSVSVTHSNTEIAGGLGTVIYMDYHAGGHTDPVGLFVFFIGTNGHQVNNISVHDFRFEGNPDNQPNTYLLIYDTLVMVYSANNVWIYNNELHLGKYPIYANNGGGGSFNGQTIHVNHNTIDDRYGSGLATTDANRFPGIALHNVGANSEITGNLIIYAKVGIFLDGNGPGGNSVDNTIVADNVIIFPDGTPGTPPFTGILFYESVYDTLVQGNIIRGKATYGIDLQYTPGGLHAISQHDVIQNNLIEGATTAVRVNGTDMVVQYNDFRPAYNETASVSVINNGTRSIIRYNLGWDTEASGSVALSSNTTYSFLHGLVATPVFVTLGANVTACGALAWTATSTHVTVTSASSCTATIYWYAQTWAYP